jgi:hexokinase
VDRESINPRFQAFEKLISGMYLGEISRNVILSLIDACPPLLFQGYSTTKLNQHYGFDTALMSDVENSKSAAEIRKVFVDHLGFKPDLISDEDTVIVRRVCSIVARRAAKLSGTAVAAVLVQTGHAKIGRGHLEGTEPLKVGVDGRYGQMILHDP